MAKFLTTTGTNYQLEELIKGASERLILISPFLKLNDRMKELLEDKNRLKIDVRIVYGKSELQPQEIEWLRGLTYIRTSFCKNLHAKCYMSEELCIITSLNLYEFSQVNNNEMGVLIQRSEDGLLYKDAYEEAQRIIRISDEVRISLERVSNDSAASASEADKSDHEAPAGDKLTSSKIAVKLGMKTAQFMDRATDQGFLERIGVRLQLLKNWGQTPIIETRWGFRGQVMLGAPTQSALMTVHHRVQVLSFDFSNPLGHRPIFGVFRTQAPLYETLFEPYYSVSDCHFWTRHYFGHRAAIGERRYDD